jgi:hypothetical protein
MISMLKLHRVALGLLICGMALAACAPASSSLGDAPPGSTILVVSRSSTIGVAIDGAFIGTITSGGTFPSCPSTSLVEETTATLIVKYVNEGQTHTIVWAGARSGSTSVFTADGTCYFYAL